MKLFLCRILFLLAIPIWLSCAAIEVVVTIVTLGVVDSMKMTNKLGSWMMSTWDEDD